MHHLQEHFPQDRQGSHVSDLCEGWTWVSPPGIRALSGSTELTARRLTEHATNKHSKTLADCFPMFQQ